MSIATADFLVIGTGVAGMWAALQAASRGSVTLVTKRGVRESASTHAQGGIAAVIDPADSFESHVRDTLTAGAGLCDETIVRLTVADGPRCVRELIDLGVQFCRGEGGDDFDLGREGGHTHRRVLHAGDITGAEIVRALADAVGRHPAITVCADHAAIDLRLADGRCAGAWVLDESTREVRRIAARATILATGGIGQVYARTSNPAIATGDGIAMAYRAGATMRNMEFVQFHPTGLCIAGQPPFLISEALRGEGGILRAADGRELMAGVHELENLAPRDIVARAIAAEMAASGAACVFLDMTHLDGEFLAARFPTIFRHCLDAGIDMRREPIPVLPLCHYSCGGVRVGSHGETDVPGLYAIGEAACTGLHGANRLASNSLLEAVVFAARAVEHAGENLADSLAITDAGANGAGFDFGDKLGNGSGDTITDVSAVDAALTAIRECMNARAGIVRTTAGLREAHRELRALAARVPEFFRRFGMAPRVLEFRNLACVAQLIVESALARHESRGCHFTLDFPAPAALEAPMPTDLTPPRISHSALPSVAGCQPGHV